MQRLLQMPELAGDAGADALVIRDLSVMGEVATVKLSYPPRGISGSVTLFQVGEGWRIVSKELGATPSPDSR
jgi:hypothetical protein